MTRHSRNRTVDNAEERGGVSGARLGRGQVLHVRHAPREHRFRYATWFWLLPMRQLRRDAWRGVRRNRWGPTAFVDTDHGDGGADALGWCEALLDREGRHDVDGEIWLQTYPRVWGYAFKPVSFWFCLDREASLRVVIAEVNSTFGERHVYLLDAATGWGRELVAAKAMHVSPFNPVSGEYRFRFFWRPAGDDASRRAQVNPRGDGNERLVSRIELWDGGQQVMTTALSGQLQPLTRRHSFDALLCSPWMTLGVIMRIHWQALQLWWRRVPWFRQPAPADTHVTHGGARGHGARTSSHGEIR